MSGTISTSGLHSGLKKKGASSSDASTTLKTSPSVNDGASRGSTVAASPKTIGPRTA